MSRGNNAQKVLRTAIKRVEKAWTKGTWSQKQNDGSYAVCLEGALFGYCSLPESEMTPAQLRARDLVIGVIEEKQQLMYFEQNFGWKPEVSIPAFNDAADTTQDDVLEVLKLALIREQTGWDPEDDYLTDQEEIDSLLG